MVIRAVFSVVVDDAVSVGYPGRAGAIRGVERAIVGRPVIEVCQDIAAELAIWVFEGGRDFVVRLIRAAAVRLVGFDAITNGALD